MHYTETRLVKEKVELRVWDHWSMYTPKGNARLKKLAQDVIDKIEAGKDVRKTLDSFVYKWERMSDYDSYREAYDTAVRECVWAFFEKVCKCKGIWDADGAWEEARERAWKRKSKRRTA